MESIATFKTWYKGEYVSLLDVPQDDWIDGMVANDSFTGFDYIYNGTEWMNINSYYNQMSVTVAPGFDEVSQTIPPTYKEVNEQVNNDNTSIQGKSVFTWQPLKVDSALYNLLKFIRLKPTLAVQQFSLKNVYAYISGKFRKSIISFYRKHYSYIDDIVKYRTLQVYQKSPKCITNGACTKCGCGTPDLFYADKACKGGCYKAMPTKDDWYMMLNRGEVNMTDVENTLKIYE